MYAQAERRARELRRRVISIFCPLPSPRAAPKCGANFEGLRRGQQLVPPRARLAGCPLLARFAGWLQTGHREI
eukprot:7893027-Lingulodinium_polyedra.AAC.1